ncbi:MAG: hypothetical protein EOO11_03530 [Chitinophagaceae bacterium]|nr:MAG: hypothetical protein EOO11_03530 [Chitinophagaceae bacterium]
MNSLLSARRAAFAILLILILTIGFHIAVLAGGVPPEIVWGGRATDPQQLHRLEAVSIAVNVLLVVVVLGYTGSLGFRFSHRVLRPAFWAMLVLFSLNTVGNVLAETATETVVFTPVTALLALLCGRVLLGGFNNSRVKSQHSKTDAATHTAAKDLSRPERVPFDY